MLNCRDIATLSTFILTLVVLCFLCYHLTGAAGVILLLFRLKDVANNWRVTRAQDVFEIQVLPHGAEEAVSLSQWKNCRKYPNHHGFIPVPQFTITDLPTDYQTDDWFNFITDLAFLTVRLRINAVGPTRPTTGPFSLDGSNASHTGSGNIAGFKVFDDKHECPCRDCSVKDRTLRSKLWWRIKITTAAHVVFDEHEVRATSVDIFYDDEAARRERRMKTVRGYKLKGSSSHIDACVYYCAFCDKSLAETALLIGQKRTNVIEGFNRIRLDIMKNKAFHQPTKAILISHPHAQTKMITVGEIKRVSLVGHAQGESEYAWQIFECEYTTPSCPGSSGGNILWLGDLRLGDSRYGWWFGTHRGSEEEGVNHGARLFIKPSSSVFWRQSSN